MLHKKSLNQRPAVLWFEPRSDSLFGAQKSMLRAVGGLSRRGWQVDLLTTREGPLSDAARFANCHVSLLVLGEAANRFGGQVLRYGVIRKLNTLLEICSWWMRASVYVARQRPGVVVLNSERAVPLLGVVAWLLRVPTIYYVRVETRPPYIGWLCARLPTACVLVASGCEAAFTKRERTKYAQKFNVLRTGRETLRVYSQQASREELQLRASARILCMVGSVSPRKNQLLAVKVLAAARERFGSVQLVIAGSSAHGHEGYANQVRDEICRLGLVKDVVWAGYLAEPNKVFAASDLALLPSKAEGLAGVLYEALASGCPVVSAAVSGSAEILVRPELGSVVTLEDEPTFIATAMDYLRRCPEPEGIRMRRREHAERTFRMDDYLDGLERLLRLVAGHNTV